MKVSVLCLLAAVASAAPKPEADPQVLLHHAAPVAPLVHHVAPATLKTKYQTHVATPPECVTLEEDLEVQSCTPRTENVCETREVPSQEITYEKRCKAVTSRHCPQAIAPLGATVVLKKREAEAEADPQLLLAGAAPYAAPYAAPVAAPVVTVKHEVPACQEITTDHCVDVPVAVEKTTPVETCHVVTKVDCVPVVHKIPKVECQPATIETHEHEVEVPVANPLGYAYYGKK